MVQPKLPIPGLAKFEVSYQEWPIWFRSVLDHVRLVPEREGYYYTLALRSWFDWARYSGRMTQEDRNLGELLLVGVMRAWLQLPCILEFSCLECPHNLALKCQVYQTWGANSAFPDVRMHAYLEAFVGAVYDRTARDIIGLDNRSRGEVQHESDSSLSRVPDRGQDAGEGGSSSD